MRREGDETARDAAVRLLAEDLGPRLLDHLFAPPDVERARTLHTELRRALEHLRGGPTWSGA